MERRDKSCQLEGMHDGCLIVKGWNSRTGVFLDAMESHVPQDQQEISCCGASTFKPLDIQISFDDGEISDKKAYAKDLQLADWSVTLILDPFLVSFFVSCSLCIQMVQYDKCSKVGTNNSTGGNNGFDNNFGCSDIAREQH